MPPRTIESIIKKLLALKKIERLGEGRSCRYRVKDASRVGSGWAQRKDGKNISPT
jgi:hypothetical protein